MLKYLLLTVAIFGFFLSGKATHNRAGEITYEQIGPLSFEITITTYTYTLSLADRSELEVSWGDNTTGYATRTQFVLLPDNYKQNTYKATHTYPGAGIYEIVVEDPNRNFGVLNIPNSVNVVFALKTILQIDPILGENNTPILLNPPIDKAALNQLFVHDLGAWDPDGDSLSFKLDTCLTEDGLPIEDYSFPLFDSLFYVNEVTGQLIWDSPIQVGAYNVAILIEEWRRGVKIGTIVRDMQINVEETDNQPPVINPLEPICVIAGTSIDFLVEASDPEQNYIEMLAFGAPMEYPINPAEFTRIGQLGAVTSYQFHWETICRHVKLNPHTISFKAKDTSEAGSFSNDFISLSDYEQVQIRVIAPPCENLTLEASNSTVSLSWSPSSCTNAIGYDIYRKEGSSGWTPDSCQTGIPASLGYEKIASTESWSDTTYFDNNQEIGLRQGIEYCYRIVARFTDGAESIASEAACTLLQNGIPTITHVDVVRTDAESGQIFVGWAKPKELDTLQLSGPFKYLIYRSEEIWGENLVLIDSLSSLNDTSYLDTGLNTLNLPYSYQIELYHDAPNNRFLIGTPHIASSSFLEIKAGDNHLNLSLRKNTPWIDSLFQLDRQNHQTLLFDSIDTKENFLFIDDSLKNGTEYCYQITGSGFYHDPNLIRPLINRSQIACAIPIDTIPPCTPMLNLGSNCDDFVNYLFWSLPADSCFEDISGFRIYYSPNTEDPLQLLEEIDSAGIFEFEHYFTDIDPTTAGCYAITAVDSFFNESPIEVVACVDACYFYELPNVFTPNNDGNHDLLVPITNLFVEKVAMKIYNRWGNLVYETEDPNINWDGSYLDTPQKVSDGVYYYVCDVYTYRLSGLEHFTLVGFVHVFSGTDQVTPSE